MDYSNEIECHFVWSIGNMCIHFKSFCLQFSIWKNVTLKVYWPDLDNFCICLIVLLLFFLKVVNGGST